MVGTTVSHYCVTGKLGAGGMGVVYEAEDLHLSRRVALKFLSTELAGDTDAVRRLRREAETIATLDHPNICAVYGIDENEENAFIAMERVNGTNLNLLMARQTLETNRLIDIALQIAGALEAAHAAGIVHRDIKPANIVVGETGQVKVLDFGLARRFSRPDTGYIRLEGSTMPGRPQGTVSYMAPERILQKPLDPRCDLFSLGVVIYQMATGRLPFAGASPSDTVSNILDKDPLPLTILAPDRPVQLERVVNRLLAKDPAARYQSATQLREALAIVANGGRRWQRLFRK
jgi:serine/threonine protein kinase